MSIYIDQNTETWIEQLQARIAELETTLQEIHQHYDDTHAEEVNELNARIAELEEEVVQYKEELDRVLKAHKKAIIRLNEWDHNLAQDFVTLLVMDLQGKKEQ